MIGGHEDDVAGGLLAQLVPVAEDELTTGPPEIRVGGRQLRDMTTDALGALRLANEPPRIFQRGGALIRLRTDNASGSPSLETLGGDAVRGELARAADWYSIKSTRQGGVRVDALPPVEVVRDLISLPVLPDDVFPPLGEIVEAPTFAADGMLVDRPGYDRKSQLWYSPVPGLSLRTIPEAPSSVDVHRARTRLLDRVLYDFPFADQASRANAFALLLLPFVRPLIEGPTPLHMIEAAKAGTGKGLLVNAIHAIAIGRTASPTAEVGDGDEWRKRILAALIDGPRFVLIDNINGFLNSGALASALTTRTIKDWVLGTSQMAEAPVRCIWIGTGNNVRMTTELARRTPMIRLVAASETPWTRPATEFRHPDLIASILRYRGWLISAALTLCRAWIVAGRPSGDVTVGSYEVWSRSMSGLLDVIGVPGFMENAVQALDHANDDQAKWLAMVQRWWEGFGGQAVGTPQLYPLVDEQGLLEGVLGDGAEQSRRAKLGKALAKQRDARYGGLKIVAAGTAGNGGCLYRLLHQAPG